MKTNKEWAKHIIKRFGKKEAYRWAIQDSWCPCTFLGYKCKECEFNEGLSDCYVTGCIEAKEYFINIFSDIIKINAIKRMIIKKTKWWNRKRSGF